MKMAKKRGRSQWGWLVFSIFLSPILAMLFIVLLGETDERRHQRIREEEEIRAKYRMTYKNEPNQILY
jgi:Na+/melibiose symporter-like transporter